MANSRRRSKRRSVTSDIVASDSRGSPSIYGNQLASPPSSSGLFVPSSPLVEQNQNHDHPTDYPDNVEDGLNGSSEPVIVVPEMVATPSPNTEITSLSRSPRTQPIHQEVLEPGASISSSCLSRCEKVKLLQITCRHGPRLLHCPTSGKHAEEEMWTSIMEEFSTKVRAGFFSNYAQVKRMNNKICRSRRRKHMKETTPSEIRSDDLATWIDRWVRVWKYRDLDVNIAKAIQSIRETMGEKRLKRIFRDRIDGDELPEQLRELIFSAPLLKKIRKGTYAIERSARSRRWSLFPSGVESDYTDEDDMEDDAGEEVIEEEPPLPSIEEDHRSGPYFVVLEDSEVIPNQRVERESEVINTRPETLERLNRLGETFAAGLKKAGGAMAGKQVSVLELAQRHEEECPPSPASAPSPPRVVSDIITQPQSVAVDPEDVTIPFAASPSGHVGGFEVDPLTSCRAGPSGLGQAPHHETGVRRGTGTNAGRTQPLEPGTYRAHQSIILGWHARQIVKAGANNTAERDHRQSVSATFTRSGHMNLRLRRSNMQGNTVPKGSRLTGIISVSLKDVMPHPLYYGMSNDEMRMEAGRQSLNAVKQRITYPWVPTTATEGRGLTDDELRPALEVVDRPYNGEREENSTQESEHHETVALVSQSHRPTSQSEVQNTEANSQSSSQGTEGLREPGQRQSLVACSQKTVDNQSNRPVRESREASNRDDPPAVSKKSLANKKTRRNSTMAGRIPSRSSASGEPNPKTKRYLNKNRITPSRFYGSQTSEDIVEDSNNLAQQSITSPQVISGSTHQTASSSQAKGKSPILPTSMTITSFSDDSDCESLPTPKELVKRWMVKPKHRDDVSTPRRDQRERQGPEDTSNNIGHAETSTNTSQESTHTSSRTDAHKNKPEDTITPSRETSIGVRQPEDGSGDRAVSIPTSIRSRSKKRRSTMVSPSNPSGAKLAEPSKLLELPEPSPPARDAQRPRTRMQLPIREPVARFKSILRPGRFTDRNSPKLDMRSSSKSISRNEPGHSRSSPGYQGTKPRVQDQYPMPNERPPVGNWGCRAANGERWMGRKSTPRRHSPYELPGPDIPRRGSSRAFRRSGGQPASAEYRDMSVSSLSPAAFSKQWGNSRGRRRRQQNKKTNDNNRFLGRSYNEHSGSWKSQPREEVGTSYGMNASW
ncbi:uncharacterized protein F4822DRAFT_235625 [Hypoxylon trugodes]|uniref:uncharacterized protein n=1 Tax=Hypoxylon trugodes TaxID=326681 RepID=UPI00218F8BCB|nr:uncharacterized protein F4822DRAFT_235625 [Hypoxylon trugodes]KAI1390420.1 hypothetical protein F4822DRAFT_235625 [Hypoxylon trugodes]